VPRLARAAALVAAVLSSLAVVPAGAAPATAATTAPVTVTAPGVTRGGITVRWRTNAKLASATLTLNGRRVAAANHLVLKGARARLALDAADGVRFGRNRLVAQVTGTNGRRQTVRRTVAVRRDAPLPAVQTRGARVAGRAIRLDGRGTRSTSLPLDYRWRVVRAPRNAKAKLTGARTTTPRLVGSLPGRYAIALTVRQRAAGRPSPAFAGRVGSGCTVGAATPSAAVPAGPDAPVASTPAADLPAAALSVVPPTTGTVAPVPAGAATAGCATHVESVDVGLNALPIGVAIDTHRTVRGVPSIVVGDQAYPLPAAGQGAAAVLLNADTLELLAFVSPLGTSGGILGPLSAFEAAEFAAQAYVNQGDPVLIVAAGVAGCCSTDPKDSPAGFSAIATYGSASGDPAPTINDGQVLGGDEDVAGEQIGWLQRGVPLDGADALFTFVSPDRATYDTQSASTPTSNTMQINGTSYYGALPMGTTAGYQVLVLDADLQPQLGTPITYGTEGTTGIYGEEVMAQLLQQASTLAGSTTFVQSINDPQPMSEYTMTSASAITALGGTSWMFLSTNDDAEYALVGNPSPPGDTTPIAPWAAETQSGWTAAASDNQGAGNGTLSGVLRRRGDSAWSSSVQSALGDTSTAPDFGLSALAVQPAGQWPYDTTPGQIEATAWIADQVGLSTGPGDCWQPVVPDFRSSYCNLSLDWNSIGSKVAGLTYPASTKPPFSRTDFRNVRAQLVLETGNIGTITTLIDTLQTPFTVVGDGAPVDAQSIAGNIIDAIPPPSSASSSASLSIAGAIFDAASIVPDVGSLLGAIGSALDFGAAVTQSDGVTVPYWQVQTTADAMGAQLLGTLQTMSGHLSNLEEILVSDWGRMSAAVAGAQGPWGISGGGLEQQESVMSLGVEQAMWAGILPSAYDLYSFPGVQNAAQVECVSAPPASLWYPWVSAASIGSFLPLNTWDETLSSAGPGSSGVLAMLSGPVADKRSSKAVDDTLAGQMYGAPQQGGAGLIQPWLYGRANWTVQTPQMSGENLECQTTP